MPTVHASIAQKIERQPSRLSSAPPTIGASAGPEAEHERHLRHHALRLGAVEAVADDRAPDDEPGARRQSLQHARQPQRLDVAGDRAAERAEREHDEAAEHDRPAAERVGQRAVPQHHEREREHVDRQRLLERDRRRRRTRRRSPGNAGRYMSTANGPEHRQRRQQRRESPRAPVDARRRAPCAVIAVAALERGVDGRAVVRGANSAMNA